jgi:hypothetical protein
LNVDYFILGVLCRVERKSNMVIKFVPFEKEQFPQIGIFKELAINLIAFLFPAYFLASLRTLMLASNST